MTSVHGSELWIPCETPSAFRNLSAEKSFWVLHHCGDQRRHLESIFFQKPNQGSRTAPPPTHGGGEAPYTTEEASRVWVAIKAFQNGVSDPRLESLRLASELDLTGVILAEVVVCRSPLATHQQQELASTWREPAIERLYFGTLADWRAELESVRRSARQRPQDPSLDVVDPEDIGLRFSSAELAAIRKQEQKQNRKWNRTEWEVLAQTWSEHCKHKIFRARISTPEMKISSLFRECIFGPTEQIRKNTDHCLSVFKDNAGVIRVYDRKGQATPWGVALKMETHNSPSAISPYGGASTGIVGVHRDILGTGLGARPIANWDVLCFESPTHADARPNFALSPDIIRRGVLKGIEDGGNQSGIPTVQGSVYFHPSFAVKPYVFAGSIGILPTKFVEKKPQVGLTLFAVGGAVGIDGLRGAVMSSRDLRQDDFSGSAVQVANAFTQRRMTDFLLEARDMGLIEMISDNGAGGLSSSIGEMAEWTGGAEIDIGQLRTKYDGLHIWERLLSESQERMSVGTSRPDEFCALAKKWQVEFDRLGNLNDCGRFVVRFQGEVVADIDLGFLHHGCPDMHLQSRWSEADEFRQLKDSYEQRPLISGSSSGVSTNFFDLHRDMKRLLTSPELCSRETICRRFDHEVQGRTLKKPFEGASGHSPRDSSLLEIPETESTFVLSHGLAPWRQSMSEQVSLAFDEALRSALLSGVQWGHWGLLDNFAWPDPIPPDFISLDPALSNNSASDNGNSSLSGSVSIEERRLSRLVEACVTLRHLCLEFSLPLVSGKDSMKNNSQDFACQETVVLSLGGSGIAPEKVPSSFFLKPNDIVFEIPLEKPTLKDSVWERITGSRFEANYHSALPDISVLKSRYERLSRVVSAGILRSAKDVSEGGLVMSVFESCLGRNVGIHLERSIGASRLLAEGYGGFVVSIDPHYVEEFLGAMPEAQRLGVVIRDPYLRMGEEQFSLQQWKEWYLGPGVEGFWS